MGCSYFNTRQCTKYLFLSYLADVDDVDDVEEPVSFELNAPDDKESDCVFKPRQSTSICSVYALFVPFTLFVLTGCVVLLFLLW